MLLFYKLNPNLSKRVTERLAVAMSTVKLSLAEYIDSYTSSGKFMDPKCSRLYRQGN